MSAPRTRGVDPTPLANGVTNCVHEEVPSCVDVPVGRFGVRR